MYRAESRYKKAYCYKGVAQRKADKMNFEGLRNHDLQMERIKRLKKVYGQTSVYGDADAGKVYDPVIVVSEAEFAEMIKGKGAWKNNLVGGGKFWCEHDTPACCDPSTETYWSM